MMKHDAKKQREFFEKRKMQQKLKNMGISLPASPRGADSGSMDLVTLFVVNQIAAKKENKGIFPLQLNLQQRGQTQTQPPSHCSPPPWDTSGLEQTKFQPFSQPRVISFYQLEKPTAAQVLFGNPEPDKARDSARHEVTFSLNQAGDKEPTLDFTLNQAENEQQFEDVFRGFSNEEYDRDASHFGSAKPKIYLKEETVVKSSSPQTVPDSQCMGVEDEECCQQMNQTCYADTINSNLGSQGNQTQSHSNPRPPTPYIKPQKNTRDYQKVMENDKALRSKDTAQFVSHLLDQTPSSEQYKCKKIANQMRDAGTQTVAISTAETCDASTQCSLVLDSVSNLYQAPVDVSVQRSATGRQTGCTDAAAESNTHTASTANPSSGGKHLPWSKSKLTTDNGEGKVILQRPINPFVDVLSVTDGRGKQVGEGRDERGQQENGPLMKDHSDDMREEVTSASRVNRLTEEPETLEEIADILLLLKQRKKEG
ncbi:hypothetical protein PAMP_014911 [Pampus punctatissimus]